MGRYGVRVGLDIRVADGTSGVLTFFPLSVCRNSISDPSALGHKMYHMPSCSSTIPHHRQF